MQIEVTDVVVAIDVPCTTVDAYDFALRLTTPEEGSSAATEPGIGVLRRCARE